MEEEEVNIAKILRKCDKPRHFENVQLYSPAYGDIVFDEVTKEGSIVTTIIKTDPDGKCHRGLSVRFDSFGRLVPQGEIQLFPSRTNKDWDIFDRNVAPFKITRDDEKNGGKYYYITDCGQIEVAVDNHDRESDARWNYRNYFNTERQAKYLLDVYTNTRLLYIK